MATIRRDLKQRDLEAYESDYNPRVRNAEGELELYGQARFYGAAVRAAAVAGWFTDLHDEAGVDELEPQEVAGLWKEVTDLYRSKMDIDPNLS